MNGNINIYFPNGYKEFINILDVIKLGNKYSNYDIIKLSQNTIIAGRLIFFLPYPPK